MVAEDGNARSGPKLLVVDGLVGAEKTRDDARRDKRPKVEGEIRCATVTTLQFIYSRIPRTRLRRVEKD
jgi:hypothetical protein